jgi:hypothetical protein
MPLPLVKDFGIACRCLVNDSGMVHILLATVPIKFFIVDIVILLQNALVIQHHWSGRRRTPGPSGLPSLGRAILTFGGKPSAPHRLQSVE